MTPTPLPMRLSRRTLIVGIIGIVSIVGMIAIYSLAHNKQSSPADTSQVTIPGQVATDKDMKRVFIQDFHTYGDYFTPEKQLAVENVLYAYASQRGTKPDLYTGIVRPNSFSQKKDPSGTMTTRFLVDIGPVDVTYILEVTGTTKDGPRPVVIQCAPEAQQKNPSVSCIDGMKTRE